SRESRENSQWLAPQLIQQQGFVRFEKQQMMGSLAK
ncbi:unnamed protein product, partial [marine sediment metagenome]